MKTKENRKGGATLIMFALSAIVILLISPQHTKAANAEKRDTSKKVYNITTYGNLSTADSSIYVLNGKKVSKAEVDKLDTKEVMNISWVSAENAAKVLDNLESESSVLFVTTYNSAEGKRVLDKINKLPNSHPFIARGGKQAVYISSINYKPQIVKLDSSGNYAVTSIGGETETTDGSNSVITVKGYKSKAGGNTISVAKPYVLTEYGSGNEVVALVNGKPLMGRAIDHLNEKLIIIDDKEASADDLKKLSAFDIEKINFKNDDYTRHQYGNKAKKGVVYIYTKKAK